jgi:hypothetical protein
MTLPIKSKPGIQYDAYIRTCQTIRMGEPPSDTALLEQILECATEVFRYVILIETYQH